MPRRWRHSRPASTHRAENMMSYHMGCLTRRRMRAAFLCRSSSSECTFSAGSIRPDTITTSSRWRRLLGPLDFEALEGEHRGDLRAPRGAALGLLERRGEPVQTVGTSVPRLELLDFGPCARNRRAAAIERQARKFAQQPLEIDREPPFQVQLLRLADRRPCSGDQDSPPCHRRLVAAAVLERTGGALWGPPKRNGGPVA